MGESVEHGAGLQVGTGLDSGEFERGSGAGGVPGAASARPSSIRSATTAR